MSRDKSRGLGPRSVQKQYRLYFVQKGTDMSPLHIEGRDGTRPIQGLKDRAITRGAQVLNRFNVPPYPTQIVVSNNPSLSALSIATKLGFESVDDFEGFLREHKIQCVTRAWADKGHKLLFPPFAPPTRLELHHGFLHHDNPGMESPSSNKRQRFDVDGTTESTLAASASPNSANKAVSSPPRSIQQVRTPDASSPPQVRLEEEADADESDSPAAVSRSALDAQASPPSPHAPPRAPPVSQFPINQELSDLLREISKLYQSAPLEDGDEWRAFTFVTMSGRLKRLDFEVSSSTINKLKSIKGFGAATMEIIQEWLNTKTSTRRDMLQTHPERIAMRQFMEIWGVGKVRARELVDTMGLRDVSQLRKALLAGKVKLDRNQYIGLECYEDIQQEMPRDEVEAIFEIVQTYVQSRFPSAELSIMGSYRRGKSSCGDVDILITHPDHVEMVPSKWLGKVVDHLCESGHIAYHLTFLPGMDPERFETLPVECKKFLTDPSHYGRTHEKKDKYNDSLSGSTTYMGVFQSPVVKGKRRRVDIKFYPYRERIYASLYFTGNGFFNRSMRLWANRRKGYTLNDHGLFDRDSNNTVRQDFVPQSEKDVFAHLGIAWKEPHERDSFDAVEGIDGAENSTYMNQKEKANESKHEWIE